MLLTGFGDVSHPLDERLGHTTAAVVGACVVLSGLIVATSAADYGVMHAP